MANNRSFDDNDRIWLTQQFNHIGCLIFATAAVCFLGLVAIITVATQAIMGMLK